MATSSSGQDAKLFARVRIIIHIVFFGPFAMSSRLSLLEHHLPVLHVSLTRISSAPSSLVCPNARALP